MKFSVILPALFGALALAAPRPNGDTSPETITDQFSVSNLRASTQKKNGRSWQQVSFDFEDKSTNAPDWTTCSISWKGKTPPHRSFRCDDGWVTAELEYFDDVQNFQVNLNHAYGETCENCNNEEDEDYEGEVGSCEVEVNDLRMGSVQEKDGVKWSEAKKSNILCPVDYD
ncbi:hypothetical protein LTS08_001400 [Lithohypha guttulata]|uniref:Uncharacterized protein n=1 Tax=Lithohypha guttulata TaxID=1690604 RepID=A0AAN7SV99_9EURO|nr:hypothetical protein LTR51_003934 [Lithohypha guttulata]KAK5082440.1 hypothetical protein LTR05_007587 [Lithohypha guttulata]KAK5105126.1 hypothetical protein LTS08_001400 [Lithohypha guttulata]